MKRLLGIFGVVFLAASGQANALDVDWPSDPLSVQENIRSKPPAVCQDKVPQDKPITLTEVVSYTLCNNPDTKGSWARVLASAARVGSSESAYLPNVDASIGVDRNSSSNSSDSSSFGASASISYLLFDFGGRAANVEATKQALLSSDFTHNSTLQNVLFSAVQSYYALYSSKAAVAAADENLKFAKSSLDAANARLTAGVSTKADKLQAETLYAQAELQKQQAANDMNINKGKLNNVMGLSPDYDFMISDEKPQGISASFGSDIGKLLETAKKQRPDLAAAAADRESAKANIDVQRSAGLPKVTLSASKDYNTSISGNNIDRDGSSIGVNVSIPLFSGFDRSYQIEAAKRNYEAEEASYKSAENDTLLDVWTSYSNYGTAEESAKTATRLVASAKESEEVALGRYNAGVGTITELLNAQSAAADARRQFVVAEYNQLVAKADLLRATGTLDENIIGENQ